jgi:DNA-binding NarL/FixJ family response regulator
MNSATQCVASSPLDEPALCSPGRIRVVVAESSRMASQLLEGAFQKHRQKFDVHTFSGGSVETLREIERKKPHVAIVSADLQDGPLMGFKVLHRLRDSNSGICTVMLLNSSERDLVIDAFCSGARGVFTRSHSIEALPKCIRVVHDGQVWVNNDQIELILGLIMRLRPLQVARPAGTALLTRREEEVVHLVAEGMRNEDISQKLAITEHTVRNYLCRIFEKLGLSSRVELVLYALSR